MNHRVWKLGSMWDAMPKAGYSRHAIEDSEALCRFETTTGSWNGKRPLRLRSSRKTKLEDFPFCTSLVLSERAVDLLKDLLAADGEFIPVELYRGSVKVSQYALYNCSRSEGVDGWEPSKRGASVSAMRGRRLTEQVLVSSSVAERLMKSQLSGWLLRDVAGTPRVVGENAGPLDVLGERLMRRTLHWWGMRRYPAVGWTRFTVISPHHP
jgi:hypothetical protein